LFEGGALHAIADVMKPRIATVTGQERLGVASISKVGACMMPALEG
jgi:hypothetical protein